MIRHGFIRYLQLQFAACPTKLNVKYKAGTRRKEAAILLDREIVACVECFHDYLEELSLTMREITLCALQYRLHLGESTILSWRCGPVNVLTILDRVILSAFLTDYLEDQ